MMMTKNADAILEDLDGYLIPNPGDIIQNRCSYFFLST